MSKKNAVYTIPRDGLVGEWKLDGNHNDTNDSSTKHTGSATNMSYVSTETGYQYQCGSFNGGTSYVAASNTLGLTSPFSVTARFKTTMTGTWMAIVSDARQPGNPAGFFININSTVGVQFATGNTSASWNGGVIATGNYCDGKWHDVFAWWDGSYNKVQIDGGQIFQTACALAPVYATSPRMVIGVYEIPFGTFSQYFNGTIQDVRQYNKVLTDNERLAIRMEGQRKLGPGSDTYMSSCVAHYDFLGDANDVVGGNNGTVTGATLTTDKFGNAKGYSFNGTTNYIAVSDATALKPTSITVSCWINLSTAITTTGLAAVVDKGGANLGYGFTIHGASYGGQDSEIAFNIGNGGTNANAWSDMTLATNTWYHVVGTYVAGSTVSMYIDGTLKGTNTITFLSHTNTAMGIGRYSTISTRFFPGKIADVKIFSRALSAEEVNTSFETERYRYANKFGKTLPAILPRIGSIYANDVSGTTYYDSGTNVRNGTTVGSPTVNRLFKSKSLVLNGTSQYVGSLGYFNPPAYNMADSYCFWIKYSMGTAASAHIIGKVGYSIYTGFHIIHEQTSELLYFRYVYNGTNNLSAIMPYKINDGKWHSVVMTYNGSGAWTGFKAYVDGCQVTLTQGTSGTVTSSTNTGTMSIGARNAESTDLYFNGQLANLLRFEATELTKNQALAYHYSTYVQ